MLDIRSAFHSDSKACHCLLTFEAEARVRTAVTMEDSLICEDERAVRVVSRWEETVRKWREEGSLQSHFIGI